jgi:L-fuculose-phosphate aldolase
MKLRQEIVAVGKRLWDRGLVAANDGNISIRYGDKILITPSGVSKGFMEEEQLVSLNPEQPFPGDGPQPSSELLMHLEVYRNRPDIQGIVHAHPPYATTMAVAGQPLTRAILTEITILLSEVPLVPFATPSTREVPDTLRPFLADHNAFLLEFHGALTLGKDLWEAYYTMERLEFYSQIIWNLKTAGVNRQFSPEQMDKLLAIKKKLQ